MVEAENGSLYTGVTKDVDRRFKQHKSGKGAKFFRSSPAKCVVWTSDPYAKSHAFKLEALIKKLNRSDKFELIKS